MVSLTKFYAGVPLPVMYSRYLYLVSFLLSALVPISLGLVCVSLIVGGKVVGIRRQCTSDLNILDLDSKKRK